MSDKSDILRAFNTYFSEFFDYVIASRPDDAALRAAKKNLDATRMANPVIVLRVWKNRICGPYAAELAEGDISFFIRAQNQAPSNESAARIVDSIRAAVKSMSDREKCDVVTFLRNLSTLSDQYYFLQSQNF